MTIEDENKLLKVFPLTSSLRRILCYGPGRGSGHRQKYRSQCRACAKTVKSFLLYGHRLAFIIAVTKIAIKETEEGGRDNLEGTVHHGRRHGG